MVEQRTCPHLTEDEACYAWVGLSTKIDTPQSIPGDLRDRCRGRFVGCLKFTGSMMEGKTAPDIVKGAVTEIPSDSIDDFLGFLDRNQIPYDFDGTDIAFDHVKDSEDLRTVLKIFRRRGTNVQVS